MPDRHGTGTNALLLDPPDAIVPSFGPGSFERHRLAAESAGATMLVEPVPSLVLDVDTGDDLSRLLEALASSAPSGRRPHGRRWRTQRVTA